MRLFSLLYGHLNKNIISRQHLFSSLPILDFFLFRLNIKINSSLISSFSILPCLSLISLYPSALFIPHLSLSLFIPPIFIPPLFLSLLSLYPSSQTFRLSKPQISNFRKGGGTAFLSISIAFFISFLLHIRVINSRKNLIFLAYM